MTDSSVSTTPATAARWVVRAEQTVTITFEVATDDAADRDALVAGYLALRRESTGLDDIMNGFFGRAMPASLAIVKTEPGPWRITSAEAATA